MNLREFGSWGLAEGQVTNPAPNGNYLGECVSLIQQLLDKVMGISFEPRGNAKDWLTHPNVLKYFNVLPITTPLQPGDIIVYGSNYGGGYGHIGLIDANGNYYDQNGILSRRIAWRAIPFKGYKGILRCKTTFDIGDPVQESVFTVKVTGGAFVRNDTNTNGKLVGSRLLKAGDTFLAVAEVQGQSVNGNNVWIKSKVGNYVWSGNLIRI
jgi:hypothetical protein